MGPVTLLVFAKAPVPGYAKTRLAPALGEAGAAELAGRLLQRTLAAALDAEIGRVVLCTSPAPDDPLWQSVALPADVALFDQGEGDLGQRMARAARHWLASGPVMLVGTDCVELSPSLLRTAAGELARHRAVIHPAADGGYALLGLHRFDDGLFRDMPWGGERVAELTLARLRALGWSFWTGETLHDIDRPEDLVHLRETGLRPG